MEMMVREEVVVVFVVERELSVDPSLAWRRKRLDDGRRRRGPGHPLQRHSCDAPEPAKQGSDDLTRSSFLVLILEFRRPSY